MTNGATSFEELYRRFEETVRRLGHHAVSNEPAELRGAPLMGDVLIVDLRDDAPVWDEVTEELLHDERPLIIVADRPRKLVNTLAGRAAGNLLQTFGELARLPKHCAVLRLVASGVILGQLAGAVGEELELPACAFGFGGLHGRGLLGNVAQALDPPQADDTAQFSLHGSAEPGARRSSRRSARSRQRPAG